MRSPPPRAAGGLDPGGQRGLSAVADPAGERARRDEHDETEFETARGIGPAVRKAGGQESLIRASMLNKGEQIPRGAHQS
jgi:hypothetical protein